MSASAVIDAVKPSPEAKPSSAAARARLAEAIAARDLAAGELEEAEAGRDLHRQVYVNSSRPVSAKSGHSRARLHARQQSSISNGKPMLAAFSVAVSRRAGGGPVGGPSLPGA